MTEGDTSSTSSHTPGEPPGCSTLGDTPPRSEISDGERELEALISRRHTTPSAAQGQLAPGVAAEELQQMKGWAAGLSADVHGLWESRDPAAVWATLAADWQGGGGPAGQLAKALIYLQANSAAVAGGTFGLALFALWYVGALACPFPCCLGWSNWCDGGARVSTPPLPAVQPQLPHVPHRLRKR
jgi:hypothetical protein